MNYEISKYSKLRDGPMKGENFEEQSYLKEMSMADAQINFRIRSRMIDIKMNQQSDKTYAKGLWSHIVWFPFFADLREGKSLQNDADLVHYFREVLKIREDRRIKEE